MEMRRAAARRRMAAFGVVVMKRTPDRGRTGRWDRPETAAAARAPGGRRFSVVAGQAVRFISPWILAAGRSRALAPHTPSSFGEDDEPRPLRPDGVGDL